MTFLDLLQAELLPAISPVGFVVVRNECFDSFDNAVVELHAPALRLRVVRERSQVFVDIGPASEPGTWVDSDLVLEHLGLMSSTSHRSREASPVLRGIAALVVSNLAELSMLFDPQHLAATKRAIEVLGEQRAVKLFGR
jgi:hypothetical protein